MTYISAKHCYKFWDNTPLFLRQRPYLNALSVSMLLLKGSKSLVDCISLSSRDMVKGIFVDSSGTLNFLALLFKLCKLDE